MADKKTTDLRSERGVPTMTLADLFYIVQDHLPVGQKSRASTAEEIRDFLITSARTLLATAVGTNTHDATTTARGFLELADQTEVNTGSDAVRAVVPSTLAVKLANYILKSDVLSSLSVGSTLPVTSQAIINYGNANWGNGGGGGGGSSGLESSMYTVSDSGNAGVGIDPETGIIGTRISVLDPVTYQASSFQFGIEVIIKAQLVGYGWRGLISGTITKTPGTEPFVDFSASRTYGGLTTGESTVPASGLLATDLSTVTASFTINDSNGDSALVERVDVSNELCFRFKWDGLTSGNYDWVARISGLKSFSGTDIVSTNGDVRLDQAIAGGSTSEDFGVYSQVDYTGAATASMVSGILGTRIDVTDPSYAESTFMLDIESFMYDIANDGQAALSVTGTIKKLSGGEPFVIVHLTAENAGNARGWTIIGTLATDLSFQTVTAHLTTLKLERVDDTNELGFRLHVTSAVSDQYLMTTHLSGTKSYGGVDIVSTNGNLF